MSGWCGVILLVVLGTWIVPSATGGVMGLSKYLRSTHKSAWVRDVRSLGTLHVDHLCIDMNQVVHGCFRSTKSPDHILAKFFIKLDNILKIVMPHKSLVLAFDGPAPYAKIQTQRERRKAHVDSCFITPGTEFMNSMESVMLCYCLQRFKKHNLSDTAIFISDGTCPGEGELKILNWIRNTMPTRSNLYPSSANTAADRTRDSVVICGSDSDILLQGLCMEQQGKDATVLQISSEGPDMLCNITALRSSIMEASGVHRPMKLNTGAFVYNTHREGILEQNEVVGVESDRSVTTIAERCRFMDGLAASPCSSAAVQNYSFSQQDLVVLFALQGNDYLPKMRSISNARVLALYGKVMNILPSDKRRLVDSERGTFNFEALWLLCKEIDKANHHLAVSLPVVMPDPLSSLHELILRYTRENRSDAQSDDTSISRSQRNIADQEKAKLEWTEEQISHPNLRMIEGVSGKKEYFVLPVSSENNNIDEIQYYLEEAHCAKPVRKRKGGTTPRLWKIGMMYNGKHYVSLKLSALKRAGRRDLAELVLKTIDADAYSEYVQMTVSAREELRKMRLRATEEANDRVKKCTVESTAAVAHLLPVDDRVDASLQSLDQIVQHTEELEGSTQTKKYSIKGIKEIQDEVNDESGDNANFEHSSVVSAVDYLQYVSDSDIEQYLKGMLWVVHMYSHGTCPDVSYTYDGRPAITALAIKKYIERRSGVLGKADDNVVRTKVNERQDSLAAAVLVPKSDARYLTADSVSITVLPEGGVDCLPPSLRKSWQWMNTQFFGARLNDNLNNISFAELVNGLQQCFDCNRSDVGVGMTTAGLQPIASAVKELNKSNKRARKNKKLSTVEEKLNSDIIVNSAADNMTVLAEASLSATSSLTSANSCGYLESVQMPDRCNSWTVLSKPSALIAGGYRGRFQHKSVTLPLPLSFRTPTHPPGGAQFFQLEFADTADSALHSSFSLIEIASSNLAHGEKDRIVDSERMVGSEGSVQNCGHLSQHGPCTGSHIDAITNQKTVPTSTDTKKRWYRR